MSGALLCVVTGYVCACWSIGVCLSVQKALTILQPAVLEDFLDAVEGFGTFCSEPQRQDLMLLSDSVTKQWEV